MLGIDSAYARARIWAHARGGRRKFKRHSFRATG